MATLTGFEMVGVFSPRLVTITQIIKSFMPMPCRIIMLAFLGRHFILSGLVRATQTGTLVK